jgi:hypothetical protein
LGAPFNENSSETYISIIQITVLIIIPALSISQMSSDIEKSVIERSTKILICILPDTKLNMSIKDQLLLVERSNKNWTESLFINSLYLLPSFFVLSFILSVEACKYGDRVKISDICWTLRIITFFVSTWHTQTHTRTHAVNHKLHPFLYKVSSRLPICLGSQLLYATL